MSKHLLFVTSTRLGDAVLSTGVLKHLIDANEGPRVTVACGPVAVPLFAAVPGLERVIPLAKRKYSLHWLDLWREAVTRFWDVIVDLRGAPLTRLLPAKRRFGLPKDRTLGHRVEMMGRVAGLAAPPGPHNWTSAADRARAAALAPAGGPVLALGPTANWRGKIWNQGCFAELAARLTDKGGCLAGGRVAVFGLEAERPQVSDFLASLPEGRVIDLMGRVSLTEAAAVMARVDIYVGNDSGLMHLAAASGTPTIGLFGPSNEDHYHPWGERCAVVRGTPYDEIWPANFNHRTTESLMGGITVEQVASAAERLIGSKAARWKNR